ncbi:MAG: hypothetical protein L3J39_04595 [Verrucomicrobiales bacterium]|nr:hypothetical protein [Verrucomicrobiales bacterium]
MSFYTLSRGKTAVVLSLLLLGPMVASGADEDKAFLLRLINEWSKKRMGETVAWDVVQTTNFPEDVVSNMLGDLEVKIAKLEGKSKSEDVSVELSNLRATLEVLRKKYQTGSVIQRNFVQLAVNDSGKYVYYLPTHMEEKHAWRYSFDKKGVACLFQRDLHQQTFDASPNRLLSSVLYNSIPAQLISDIDLLSGVVKKTNEDSAKISYEFSTSAGWMYQLEIAKPSLLPLKLTKLSNGQPRFSIERRKGVDSVVWLDADGSLQSRQIWKPTEVRKIQNEMITEILPDMKVVLIKHTGERIELEGSALVGKPLKFE